MMQKTYLGVALGAGACALAYWIFLARTYGDELWRGNLSPVIALGLVGTIALVLFARERTKDAPAPTPSVAKRTAALRTILLAEMVLFGSASAVWLSYGFTVTKLLASSVAFFVVFVATGLLWNRLMVAR